MIDFRKEFNRNADDFDKLMVSLLKSNEMLRERNDVLVHENTKLKEYKWMYEDLCK